MDWSTLKIFPDEFISENAGSKDYKPDLEF